MTRNLIKIVTRLRDYLPSLLSSLMNIALGYIANGGRIDRRKSIRHWRHIVTIYTMRCLKFDRDVLPALSGLANLIQPVILDTYLGGLWREDLHR